MLPFDEALRRLDLQGRVSILPVLSGYPSPKYINLVLRQHGGKAYLFESSAARDDIVEQVGISLNARGVERLDAVLVTHCHGDHGGGAGVVAGRGRPPGERAPIYLHSAGYRFLTHPDASFLHETYEIFLARSQWGLLEYNTLSDEQIIGNALRKRLKGYFRKTPKSALHFVDHGQLPDGIAAVFTPGHSHDCVLYYDEELRVAVPGDTIICTGAPDKPGSEAYVVPIFTVAGQVYSMAYESYLRSIRVLRSFFRTHEVRAIFPPHGRFAVTEPLAWVDFAESYFRGIYRALIEDFFGDSNERWQTRPFRARDLSPYIPSAGSHPVSTPSHVFGMLCALADEGYLSMTEHQRSRQLSFELEHMPPNDYVERRLALEPGALPVYRNGQR